MKNQQRRSVLKQQVKQQQPELFVYGSFTNVCPGGKQNELSRERPLELIVEDPTHGKARPD